MDIEKILNNVVFNYGWRVDSDFILFGKNNSIKIIFDSIVILLKDSISK